MLCLHDKKTVVPAQTHTHTGLELRDHKFGEGKTTNWKSVKDVVLCFLLCKVSQLMKMSLTDVEEANCKLKALRLLQCFLGNILQGGRSSSWFFLHFFFFNMSV